MFRRVADLFPLAPFGVATVLAAVAGYTLFAGPESDYILRVVAGTAVLLAVAAAVAVLVGLAGFVRCLRRAPRPELAGEAERGACVGLSAPFFGRWLALRADVAWRSPRGARAAFEPGPDGELVERVRFDRRQGVDRVERRVRVEDPFGLARVGWTEAVDQPVRVAPWRGQLDRAPELFALARGDALPHPSGGLDGDPMDLRPYQVGDPLRLVAWKLYARTGELDVRVPERATSPERRTAAYLITGLDDEPAAAAAWVALERGLLGRDWLFGTDGAEPTSSLDEAKLAILRSSEPGRAPAADLSAFLAAAGRGGARPAHVLLFAPGRPGPWLERALAHAGPDVTLLTVVDAVAAPVRPAAWWQRAEPVSGSRVVVASEELDAVCAAFERRGAGAFALARTDGRVVRARSGPWRAVA
jgi:hypothetical protein